MALFSRPPIEPPVLIRGAKRSFANDWYHLMLRTPWWVDLLAIASVFLLINLLFAFGYRCTGGVAGARPGSFSDLFFFSVQTLGTIGYGAMFPASLGAHILVTSEAFLGILVVALSTGVVFSKFSVIRARVRFATTAVITPYNGLPTVMFRIGHERSSRVFDVVTRVVLTRTERTAEGILMYRMYDLVLERDHAPALSRSWTIMHRITETSPLFGVTPASFVKDEIELLVALHGVDEASGQSMHARKTYFDGDIRWGARHADMLSESSDGAFVVDMACFDQVIPTAPTSSFPYPSK